MSFFVIITLKSENWQYGTLLHSTSFSSPWPVRFPCFPWSRLYHFRFTHVICLCTVRNMVEIRNFWFDAKALLANANTTDLSCEVEIVRRFDRNCNFTCAALNKVNPSCDHTRHCSTETGCRDTETGRAPGSQSSQTTRHRQSLTETCHLYTNHS